MALTIFGILWFVLIVASASIKPFLETLESIERLKFIRGGGKGEAPVNMKLLKAKILN